MRYTILFLFILIGCKNEKEPTKKTMKPLLVFIHGYGGNENSFLELSNDLKNKYEIELLQGFYQLGANRYSWGNVTYNEITNTWFDKKEGLYSIFKLRDKFKDQRREIILLGESQGASIGYALMLNYPNKFKKLIAINSYIDVNLLIKSRNLNYNESKILRFNSNNDIIINKKMVEFSSNLLDSLSINNNIIMHNKGHEYGKEELTIIKNWLSKK